MSTSDGFFVPKGCEYGFLKMATFDDRIEYRDLDDSLRYIEELHPNSDKVAIGYPLDEHGNKHGLLKCYDKNDRLSYEMTYRDGIKNGPHIYYRANGKSITIYRIDKETMGIDAWQKRTGKTPIKAKSTPIKRERTPIIRRMPVQRKISTLPAKAVPTLLKTVVTSQKRASTPFIRSNNPVQISLKDERNCTPYDCIEIFTRCDVRLDGTREYYDRKNVRRCKQLFHDNGELFSQIFYDTEMGKIPTDKSTFDKKGKLCGITRYNKDGEKHGQEIIIHPTGSISIEYYHNGIDVGSIAAWLQQENPSNNPVQILPISNIPDQPEEPIDSLETEIQSDLRLFEECPPNFPPEDDIREALSSIPDDMSSNTPTEIPAETPPLRLVI